MQDVDVMYESAVATQWENLCEMSDKEEKVSMIKWNHNLNLSMIALDDAIDTMLQASEMIKDASEQLEEDPEAYRIISLADDLNKLIGYVQDQVERMKGELQ